MKAIVVATDFSSRSDRAIRRGTLLARQHGASLILLHVIDDDQPQRIVRAEESAARALLMEQAQSLKDIENVDCRHHLVTGDPFDAIGKTVEELEADLLVIGPHRRQTLRDIFIGTTAERVIRSSRRPVLMAGGALSGFYRRILLAVDLSDSSAAAMDALTRLELARDASVSVLHVYDALGSNMPFAASDTKEQRDTYIAAEEERASARLTLFLDSCRAGPVRRILKLEEAPPARTIWTTAQEISADLLMVGTHGRSGLGKLFLGSVAGELLRLAECDVLVVPSRTD